VKDKYYYGKCGNCVNSEYYKTIAKNIKIYCSYYKAYYYADNTCNHYRGAYVTTAVCDILGKENFNEELTKIKELRIKIMEKDLLYKNILDRYDKVGPIIAKCLMDKYNNDKDKTLANNLYALYIKPTIEMYNDKDYIGAIEKYCLMEDTLEECFNLRITNHTNLSEIKIIKYRKENEK